MGVADLHDALLKTKHRVAALHDILLKTKHGVAALHDVLSKTFGAFAGLHEEEKIIFQQLNKLSYGKNKNI